MYFFGLIVYLRLENNNNMRNILFIILLFPVALYAQFLETRTASVRSLQIFVNGESDGVPVIGLNSDDEIKFAFDEMSHIYRRYTYKITHCNSDWNPSELFPIDYLDGFNDQTIEDWENSENTTQLYTHYELTLPNDDVSFKVSGNYMLEIVDDENDSVVAVFRFAVVDRRFFITAEVSGNTDIDFNKTHQQLSFNVGYSGVRVSSPAAEVKPVIYQNRRFDNRVEGIVPTYITGNELQYVHNRKLIFDAGNEYRRFELTDPYSPGMNVESIKYFDPSYHADIYVDRAAVNYRNDRDENGRYFINTLEGYGSDIEADYAVVHFTLNAPYRTDGHYYLLGDAWGNRFLDSNILEYDYSTQSYTTAQLLKFGLYNYQYVWVPAYKAGSVAIAEAEGSFYNTDNEYLLLIYHRAPGGRYDELLGFLQMNYILERN